MNPKMLVAIGVSVCDVMNIYTHQLTTKSKNTLEARKMFSYVAIAKFQIPLHLVAAYIQENAIQVSYYVSQVSVQVDLLREARTLDVYIAVMEKTLSLKGVSPQG